MFTKFARAVLAVNVFVLGCSPTPTSSSDDPLDLISQWQSRGKSESWSYVGNLVADGAVYRRLRVIEAIELGDSKDSTRPMATIEAGSESIVVNLSDRQNNPRQSAVLTFGARGWSFVIADERGAERVRVERDSDGLVKLAGDDFACAIREFVNARE